MIIMKSSDWEMVFKNSNNLSFGVFYELIKTINKIKSFVGLWAA